MEDLTADKRIPMKVKRFHQKRTTANVFDMVRVGVVECMGAWLIFQLRLTRKSRSIRTTSK